MESKTTSCQQVGEPGDARRQAALAALQKLRAAQRKGLRTYLGLWGLAFDRVAVSAFTLLQQGTQLAQEAESRGEEVEQAMQTQIRVLEQQAVAGLVWLRQRIDEALPSPTTAVVAQTIPLAVEPATPPVSVVASSMSEPTGVTYPDDERLPLANYGQLMAKQVIDQLGRLTVEELNALFAYEKAHAARITVLRALDQTIRRKMELI